MIEDLHPVLQAFSATLFTWAVTAAGSALVFVFHGQQRKFLDASLGFAAGVMLAASYWSLLEPSIEHARLSGSYGKNGEYSFFPAVLGFLFGAAFLIAADRMISSGGSEIDMYMPEVGREEEEEELGNDIGAFLNDPRDPGSNLRRRGVTNLELEGPGDPDRLRASSTAANSWKRLLLLIVAITVHNIPEGLAVGVAFGSIGEKSSYTFAEARNLALGIGIQNFPEGLAVSIPLRASGMSPLTSFWYGQLSGMVEPVFGVLGALGVMVASPLLPYVLSFAAGAMIFVVLDDIIPEAQNRGNGRLATLWAMMGFSTMMTLEVALG